MPARHVANISELVRHVLGQKHYAAWRGLFPFSANVHLQIPRFDDEDLVLAAMEVKGRPPARWRDGHADGDVVSRLPPNDLEQDRISKGFELLTLMGLNDDWLHGGSLAQSFKKWSVRGLFSGPPSPTPSSCVRPEHPIHTRKVLRRTWEMVGGTGLEPVTLQDHIVALGVTVALERHDLCFLELIEEQCNSFRSGQHQI